MNSYSLLFKQYFKNKFLCIFTILFNVAVFFRLIYSCTRIIPEVAGPLGYLQLSLEMSVFSFVFFMFVAYEYLNKVKQNSAEELLKTTKNGYVRYYFNAFSVLFTISAVYTVVFFIVNIAVYFSLNINDTQYFAHIVLNILLNILWVSVLAILIGGTFSFLKSRIVSYVLMVLIVFVSTPVFLLISESIYAGTGVNISSFCNFFNIFPPLTDWTPFLTFGYSLLPYRVELLAFWTFLFLMFLSVSIFAKRKAKYFYMPIVCVVVCCVSLVLYFQPASKVASDSFSLFSDQFYYDEHEQQTSEPLFEVERYDLKIDIDRQLEVEANIFVDKSDLDEYDFTLYHGYKIDKVTDKNGKELEFKQDGDYFTVENNDEGLSEICISYAGSAPRFFSNSQGTSLPGWFAYYPQAGKHEIFIRKSMHFNRIFCPYETEFNVNINSPKTVYCNLEKSGDSFSGRSNGLTLVSGFYRTVNCDGIEVVYPYLRAFKPSDIENYIKEYKELGVIDENHKKLLIFADFNFGSVYEMYCEFEDHIATVEISGLTDLSVTQSVPEYKLSLNRAYRIYKEDVEAFNIHVDSRKDFPNSQENVYILLSEKMSQENCKELEEKIEKYLADDSDTTDQVTFLKNLQ